jgi:hypothetical protein
MVGRRIPDPGSSWEIAKGPQPGDYWLSPVGWKAVTPNGVWCWLRNHHVEEHEDGTITVAPNGGGHSNSILASNGTGNKSWHGYIDRGTWTECS